MPLADHDRGVALGTQCLRQRWRIQRQRPAIAGKPRVVVGEPAGSHRMRIAPGQQRCACWRADRMRGVVVEAQTPCRQCVDVGRVNLAAKATHICVAHVVHVDDDNIGRALGGASGFRPPGFGFGTRGADLTLKAARECVP